MNDYISREALLKRLNDFNEWCRDGRLQGSLFAADVIKDIPAADVQPVKHGRWTYPYKDKDINQCSECRSYVQDKISNVREMFAYCPFCGARKDYAIKAWNRRAEK